MSDRITGIDDRIYERSIVINLFNHARHRHVRKEFGHRYQ